MIGEEVGGVRTKISAWHEDFQLQDFHCKNKLEGH